MATVMALVENARMYEQRESGRRELETLDHAECMMLLATVPVGRVAFCVEGEPRIEVINFVVDDGSVLMRMASSSKTAAVGRGARFALEADRIDEVNGTGWDVTVVGTVAWLTEPGEIERTNRLVHPWAPGERPYLARLTPQRVFGRRLRALPASP